MGSRQQQERVSLVNARATKGAAHDFLPEEDEVLRDESLTIYEAALKLGRKYHHTQRRRQYVRAVENDRTGVPNSPRQQEALGISGASRLPDENSECWCIVCNTPFRSRRPTAKYCGEPCRVRAIGARKAAQEDPMPSRLRAEDDPAVRERALWGAATALKMDAATLETLLRVARSIDNELN